MSDPLISCTGIHRRFRTGTTVQKVLRGVDLEVKAGEMVSLVGSSGAGKSTLLHILGLLDPPNEGEIHYGGERVDSLGAAAKARIRNKGLGFVFQFYHLLPELTALQNVALSGMMSHSLPSWLGRRQALRNRALELLDRMGMTPHLHKRPNKLSGGERQRVALARAIFAAPPVVFCDEPTGNLDRQTAEEIMGMLFEFNREDGMAFVVVTHDEHVAARIPRQVRLEEGRIVTATRRSAITSGLIIPETD